MPDIKVRFGAFVKSARTEKQLTQTEVSKLAGISQNTISDIERGAKEPSLSIALKVCRALELDINEFMKSYT